MRGAISNHSVGKGTKPKITSPTLRYVDLWLQSHLRIGSILFHYVHARWSSSATDSVGRIQPVVE